jgi:glutaredoxin
VASGCHHCAALVADLERRNVAFVCINLSESPERIAEVASATYERRLPVLIDHERCSLGFAGASSSFDELGLTWPPPRRAR